MMLVEHLRAASRATTLTEGAMRGGHVLGAVLHFAALEASRREPLPRAKPLAALVGLPSASKAIFAAGALEYFVYVCLGSRQGTS